MFLVKSCHKKSSKKGLGNVALCFLSWANPPSDSLHVFEPTPFSLRKPAKPTHLFLAPNSCPWLPSWVFAYRRRRLLLLCHFLNISVQPWKTAAHLSCLQHGALRQLEVEHSNTYLQWLHCHKSRLLSKLILLRLKKNCGKLSVHTLILTWEWPDSCVHIVESFAAANCDFPESLTLLYVLWAHLLIIYKGYYQINYYYLNHKCWL